MCSNTVRCRVLGREGFVYGSNWEGQEEGKPLLRNDVATAITKDRKNFCAKAWRGHKSFHEAAGKGVEAKRKDHGLGVGSTDLTASMTLRQACDFGQLI
jgi:hypothetical protein